MARTSEGENWKLLGILPLYDPPREDSADTIRQTEEHGVQVTMVTGDNVAIAKEISQQLGMGMIGVVETFGILLIAKLLFHIEGAQLQSFIYLKLAVAGHLTLLVVRKKGPFLSKPYPAAVLLLAILGTQILAVLIVGLGFLVAPIAWSYIGFIWIYCIAWVFIEDWVKINLYKHLDLSGKRHTSFLSRVQERFHSHIS